MNEKQKLIAALKQTYNAIESPVLQTIINIPSYYKNPNGNHHLVGNIHVCIFGGANTKEGTLGCVTFCYHSKTKIKGCRNVTDNAELFKFSFVAFNADETMEKFKIWLQQAYQTMKTWKEII